MVRGLHRFDGRSAFPTWVYRITTNVCLDEARRRKRRPPTVELVADTGPAGGRLHDVTVLDRMTVDDVSARLPEEFRTAVVLR